MFESLIESNATSTPRRGGWTMASVAVHAALISAAVALTLQNNVSRAPMEPESRSIIYTLPEPTRPTAPTVPEAPTTFERAPTLPVFSVPSVPSFDFQPRPDRGIATDIGDPARVPISISTGVASGLPSGGVYPEHMVDRAVLPRNDNGSPAYPSQLRVSGLEGEVRVRFVVDSAGRVEAPSIEIVHGTHALFGDAVRRWLERTRYVPAEVAGRRVRQLVEQRVNFTLRP